MNATGIVRRIDDLGRLFIPKEIKRKFDIYEGTPMEIFVSDEGILLKKYESKISESRKENIRFEWIYHAFIYSEMDGSVFYEKKCETYEEAQDAIEKNIGRFADKYYPPTGHINKDYVQVY